jgi:hypothetical protein
MQLLGILLNVISSKGLIFGIIYIILYMGPREEGGAIHSS